MRIGFATHVAHTRYTNVKDMSRGIGKLQQQILEIIHNAALSNLTLGCPTSDILETLYPIGPRVPATRTSLTRWVYPEAVTAKVRRSLRSLEERGLIKKDERSQRGFWRPAVVTDEMVEQELKRLETLPYTPNTLKMWGERFRSMGLSDRYQAWLKQKRMNTP